mmetsp:Transcript_19314/g.38595  ORF Transcript_19314/g.38595 Transcript_19314/m.38595 type:complete len:282 (+) Transcript_19314:87-932(+)
MASKDTNSQQITGLQHSNSSLPPSTPSKHSGPRRSQIHSNPLVTPDSSDSNNQPRVSFLHVVPTILDRLTLTEDLDSDRKSLYEANSLRTFPYANTPDKSQDFSVTLCTPSPVAKPGMDSVMLTPNAPALTFSLPSRWASDPTASTLSRYYLSIPTHTVHSSHVTYTVTLTSPSGILRAEKRYSDFVRLRDLLAASGHRHALPGKQALPFLFNRQFSASFINRRTVGLNRFLTSALSLHGSSLEEIVRVKGTLQVSGVVSARDDALAEFFNVTTRVSIESW